MGLTCTVRTCYGANPLTFVGRETGIPEDVTQSKINAFWETSHFQVRHTLKREFRESDEQLRVDYERKTVKFADLEDHEEKVYGQEYQFVGMIAGVHLWSSHQVILYFFIVN